MFTKIILTAVTSPVPPELKIIECNSTYNNVGTINLFVTWQIPQKVKAWLSQTISHFNIFPALVNAGNSSQLVYKEYPLITVNNNVSYAPAIWM